MLKIHYRKNNICITILTCVCVGNILLYIAFTNLQAEYIRREQVFSGIISSRYNLKREEHRMKNKDESFIVNEPSLCEKKKVDLLIIVCSSLDHFNQRKAIRETWGNYTFGGFTTKLIFLVGYWKERQLSKINKAFLAEMSHHRDIVQGNFVDSYRNLTLKSIFMLKWVTLFCNHVKYVLKADDDMYINIPNLFRALNKQVLTKFLMGNLILGAQPVQDKFSKWYTPKTTFPEEQYPPYLSGTAYVISGSVVPDLYNVSKDLKPFWLEDIFITGICAKAVGVYHIHRNDMTFDTPQPYGCTFKSLISGHKVKWQNMYQIHKDVINGSTNICDKNKIII